MQLLLELLVLDLFSTPIMPSNFSRDLIVLRFQVHRLMCAELIKLINSILKILPETEEARPRGSIGIGALCLLNNETGNAKLLLQKCSESSKLYLVSDLQQLHAQESILPD